LGVLASDCISSSACGTEEILWILVPVGGAAAFTLPLPVTGAVLCVLVLLRLCYADVVVIYTWAGGSYVVARGNFGADVGQVAVVALLVDCVVTVAVQVSVGSSALILLARLVGGGWSGLGHVRLSVCAGVVVLLVYGNLRGVRAAGRAFAWPAYLFVAVIGALVAAGLLRWVLGDLPRADLRATGVVPVGQPGGRLAVWGVAVYGALRVRQWRLVPDGPGGGVQRHLRLLLLARAQRAADAGGDERRAGRAGAGGVVAGASDARGAVCGWFVDGACSGGSSGLR
jgi:amino acid transporter